MKYITTSIAYPNAQPHIGYALELVQADFLAREYVRRGEEVQLLTGVDEHGLKIQQAASKRGISPEELVSENSALFQCLADSLNLKYSRYIHTTDADHIAMAQVLWKKCVDVGDIYRRQYRAWYDIKEEAFLGLVDEHPDASVFGIDSQFIEQIDEENYFFRLSRYKEQLLDLLKNEILKVSPPSRGQEIINFVREKGLEDVSISRESSKLRWGVPVPNDPSQVMYVWFDALTNYVTAAAEINNDEITPGKFWPPTVQCIGYDIQRFHLLIWPAILLSAGLTLPNEVLVHGFITDEHGLKMSKSIGNVIDPLPLLEKYGADPVRWYLLKEVATTVDTRVRTERIGEVYASDLANTLGNLVSRLCNMATRYAGGTIPRLTSGSEAIAAAWQAHDKAFAERDFQKALAAGLTLLVACNQGIEAEKPWALAKDEMQHERLHALLAGWFEQLREAMLLLSPALPETSLKLDWLLQDGLSVIKVPESIILFPRI